MAESRKTAGVISATVASQTRRSAGRGRRFEILGVVLALGILHGAGQAISTGRNHGPSTAPPGTSAATKAEPYPFAPAHLDSVHVGLPPTLELESGIKDPVFGLLVGLVSSGVYGTITGDRIASELERLGATSPLPYRSLKTLVRLPAIAGQTATLKVEFNGDLKLPIPYSILGYHPGSFTASEDCIFREWIFSRLVLARGDDTVAGARPATVELDDVHLFGIERGKVTIDIDGWLDALMGDALDDTDVTCLMLCRHDGEWLGFAMGYNHDGQGRSGAISFARDQILFPTPSELRSIGPRIRGREEALMSVWRAKKPGG